MKGPRINPGTYVEITEDINAIPAGVYQLDSTVEGGGLCFVLGKNQEAGFIVSRAAKSLIRPVSKDVGKEKKLSLDDFLDRYYELYENLQQQQAVFDPEKPFTCAFINPEVARELH